MTIAKMCTKIKQNLITIVAAVLAALVLFFNVASVSAFNGRPSGPPPNRHGQGFYRANPGPRYYRAAPFSPYGGPRRDGYGEIRAVRSRGEAQRVLNDYYM